jgi:type I restriction enzyme S subunit
MKLVEIQSIGEVFNGKTPSKSEQRSVGRPILKIKDMDENGKFRDNHQSYVDSDFYSKYSKKKLKAKDTIILNAAHNSDYVGNKNAFVGRELDGVIATGEWLIIRISDASPEYINHFLRSPLGKKKLKTCVKGIHLYPKDVGRITVPISSPKDQKRIAHLLGKVEALIVQRKQNLQQLDELLKSVFLEMFGDPILNPHKYPVKMLSEFYINPKEGTKCGPFGSALKKHEFVNSGVPVWNMDNISLDGRMISPFRMWITQEKFQKLSTYSVIDDDIIISRAGTVGKMCVAKMNDEPAIISTNLIRVRLSNQLRPLHIVSLMTFCKGRLRRLKVGADGTFTHMNTGILDMLEFPYPPIKLQNQFATLVEKTDEIKALYKQSLNDIENLYGALSQKAFKGELDLSQIPLPEEDTEVNNDANKPQATESASAEQTEFITELRQLDSGSFTDKKPREKRLRQWFNEWLTNSSRNSELTLEDFWSSAGVKALDYILEEDDNIEFNVSDYDLIKAELFTAIENGTIEQITHMIEIEVDGKKTLEPGNQIILKKLG